MEWRDALGPLIRRIIDLAIFVLVFIPLPFLIGFHIFGYIKKNPTPEKGSVREVLQEVGTKIHLLTKNKKLPAGLKEFVIDTGFYPGFHNGNGKLYLSQDPKWNLLIKEIKNPADPSKNFGPYLTETINSYLDEWGHPYKIFEVLPTNGKGPKGMFVLGPGPNKRVDTLEIKELKEIQGGKDIYIQLDFWPKFLEIGDDSLFMIFRG